MTWTGPHTGPRDTARGEITRRQTRFLHILRNVIACEGLPPTHRELAALTGIKSTNGVADYLKALERKGYLERLAGKARGLRLTAKGREAA